MLKMNASFHELDAIASLVCLGFLCRGTGGSRLSRTAVKPDSRLARIFVAKFLCIIKLLIIIG